MAFSRTMKYRISGLTFDLTIHKYGKEISFYSYFYCSLKDIVLERNFVFPCEKFVAVLLLRCYFAVVSIVLISHNGFANLTAHEKRTSKETERIEPTLSTRI